MRPSEGSRYTRPLRDVPYPVETFPQRCSTPRSCPPRCILPAARTACSTLRPPRRFSRRHPSQEIHPPAGQLTPLAPICAMAPDELAPFSRLQLGNNHRSSSTASSVTMSSWRPEGCAEPRSRRAGTMPRTSPLAPRPVKAARTSIPPKLRPIGPNSTSHSLSRHRPKRAWAESRQHGREPFNRNRDEWQTATGLNPRASASCNAHAELPKRVPAGSRYVWVPRQWHRAPLPNTARPLRRLQLVLMCQSMPAKSAHPRLRAAPQAPIPLTHGHNQPESAGQPAGIPAGHHPPVTPRPQGSRRCDADSPNPRRS